MFSAQWIRLRGEIEWPSRSPDLTPLVFLLWGYLKDKFYRIKPTNLEDLKQNIREEVALINPALILNAVDAFYRHLARCQHLDGE